MRDVPAARLKQFFVPRGDTYQVSKDVRELCVFSVHDLIKPFSFDVFRDRMELFAADRRRLRGAAELAQHEVDAVFAPRTEAAVPARRLPKGLTPQTAALVERAVRAAENDLAAIECADLVGLSRVSARRYLEHFVNSGLAEVHLRYGSAGRPERRYRWR